MINIQLNQRDERGFTLIEMAIVMLISGIMLSLMGSALLAYLKQSRVQTTEFRLETIQETINNYLSINRRYPCPARRNVAPGDATAPVFGREVSTDCRGGGIAGTADAGTVRIGSVPTRDLNLPDEFAFDGWGRRFTYAVSKNQASIDVGGTDASLYVANEGQIRIIDAAGNDIIAPAGGPPAVGGAHYVLLSHGLTGQGAFVFSGNQFSTCSGTRDTENCNDDDTFLTTLVNSDADNATFFDDYLRYQGQAEILPFIPTGAVMAFALAACPAGWADYLPAEGKFVIGADAGTANVDHQKFRVDITAGSSLDNYDVTPHTAVGPAETTTLNIALGTQMNVADTSGIPPYVALLYCEKLPE